jgi:hypothetical protein
MGQNEHVTFIKKSGGSIMKDITVLGIDLAKNVFQLHGTDAIGKMMEGPSKSAVRSRFQTTPSGYYKE